MMQKLPNSLSIGNLLLRECPSDMTLAEMNKFLMTTRSMKAVMKQSRHPDRFRIRYLNNNGQPYPETMTVGKMRELAEKKQLTIAIDDGEGGALVNV
jgi:hypothetical protein